VLDELIRRTTGLSVGFVGSGEPDGDQTVYEYTGNERYVENDENFGLKRELALLTLIKQTTLDDCNKAKSTIWLPLAIFRNC
jgi:hypothetical protein